MMGELSTPFQTPTQNPSIPESPPGDTSEKVTGGIMLFICLLGLVGNGIVLWFLGFRIKRNPFTTYILNLAVADIGYLLCTFVFCMTEFMEYVFVSDGDDDEQQLQKTFDELRWLMYNASLYVLTAISAERCLSVLCPIWYRCYRPRHLSAIVCVLLWALAFLMTGIRSYVCFNENFQSCQKAAMSMYVLSFLIFAPIMVISNLILFITVHCSLQHRQPGRLYTVILLTVLFFLLFTVPLSVQSFFQHFNYFTMSIQTCFMLVSINSSINPVIYFLVGSYTNRQFKASISTAFQRVFEDTTDSTTQRSSVNRLSGETATEISDSTQSETLTSRDRISSRL
ncbi:mas-related G-protein coupled receptor member H [Alligator mississippiensis]|uniref:mas-related G-protein coupled receptor member H n=1 Tax=Alligator mississippiensis TaxID=8496 RepID=UPI00090731C7|nr:mas-related G-protein coupled receptor member H [Alligator mississippiensis]